MSETGQRVRSDDADDPDRVDGGQPRNQYDPVNVPLDANVSDQRAAEDEAEARDQLRKQKDRVAANQVLQGGAIYTRPGDIPSGDVAVRSDDNIYIELQKRDADPPPNRAELARGGGEHIDAGQGQGQNQYEVVPGGELLAHINSVADAVDNLRAQAAAAEAAQDAHAAQAARYRRVTIINSVLGGIAILSTVGALLYAFFTRPKESSGPLAMDVDGGNDLDPAKKATVDVAGRARAGQDGSAIDPASIDLASHDDGTTKKMTIAAVGVWDVVGDGTVSFTPDAKFQGGPVSIIYTIGDTGGARSARAQITFGFRSKAQPGTGGPIVQSFEETHTIADTIVIDVEGAAKPGPSGAAVKPDSIVLRGAPAATPKKNFQRGIGTWTAGDDGKITFVPIEGFVGGGAFQAYTIADANGNTSDGAAISLSFYKRPRVFDILFQAMAFVAGQAVSVNVVDGSAGVPAPIPDPAFSIDPASVVLTGVTKSEGEAKGPDANAKNGMKQLVVEGEGTWDASDKSGKVTFTPDPELTGDPHPVTYQVADSKGILSNVGTLTMSAVAGKIEAALGNVNQLDDAAFWTMYENKVVKADLGDDPVGKLLLMRAVTSDLWLNTRNGLDPATRDTVLSRRDGLVRGVLGPDFDIWRQSKPGDVEGPLSPEKLFTMSKAYDDSKVGLPNIALATRYIRLTYIHLMLGFAARYIENQTSVTPTGGAAPQNDGRNG